ncbi:CbiX/SirB N-terminal domain-containing protein [Ruegeria sp. Ofav3-42]|uniref:CbiX/SirB N-terminal domain-containing protein n=1 Tax=Ruegeria sp. Ofav3-42 TaxID=2917759 RepID=UPI001EF736F3|nr:CbiX/SirB N-terminal domain-containing protein [Ruegeria sp. Ofav3-42]MCG7519086.1 cobalamin biosynthesis protein CbiX [Ruegeria sp. Ofav3-42]
MPHALIVAHGQPSDPDPAEAALAAYAAEVDGYCDGVSVHSATLAAPGMLEARLNELPEDTVIYPLFMAKGWFVTSALPKRLGDRDIGILNPLGVDPDLPALVATALRDTLSDRHWDPAATDLVLAAHGSGRSRNPSAVADAFSKELAEFISFRSIHLGFVEEAPSISEAASGTGDQALCLPFFACTGGHVQDDVPQELDRADFSGYVMPVVGELPAIKRHIANSLVKAFQQD